MLSSKNFQEWLRLWGERYASPYIKNRRLDYGNTCEGRRWLGLWSTLYVQPYFEARELERRQKKERERRRMEREEYLRGYGGIRKKIVETDFIRIEKERTVAEQELAANRWLSEWRVENNIRRQWEYNDDGYESMEDGQ